MNITGLAGTAHLQEQLKEPLAHAYILSGPEADSTCLLAQTMARFFVCRAQGERPCNLCPPCAKAIKGIHPDILITAPGAQSTREEILVSQIREITGGLHILPNEAKQKVYLVKRADSMNASAQNAFLKALEEPPSFVTFLLIAENPAALLPTVRSRCAHLSLTPTDHSPQKDEGPHTPLLEAFWTALPTGGLKLLEFCATLEKTDRTTLESFIDICHTRLIESLKQNTPQQAHLITALDLFESLRTDIRFNVSPGHIAGKIAATLT